MAWLVAQMGLWLLIDASKPIVSDAKLAAEPPQEART